MSGGLESPALDGIANLTLRGKRGAVLEWDGIVAVSCPGLRIAGLAISYPPGRALDVSDCPGLVLEKLDIVVDADTAIHLEGCDGALLRRCSVRCQDDEAALENASGADLVVERCSFEGGFDTGGMVLLSPSEDGASSDRTRFSKNRCRNSGIVCAGQDLVIDGNSVNQPHAIAIELGRYAPTARARVERNRIVQLRDDPPAGRRAMELFIDDSVVARNRVEGILDGGTSPVIDGVRLYGTGNLLEKNALEGADTGFDVSGDGNTLRDNRMLGGDAGIVTVGSDVIVEGNSVTPRLRGIALFEGAGCSLAGNRVRGNPDLAFVIDVSDSAISGNRLIGPAGIGFWLVGAGNTLTGNTALRCTLYDVSSEVPEAANTFVGNRFETFVFPE